MFQVLGLPKDYFVEPKATCRVGRSVQQWIFELAWILLRGERSPWESHGNAFEENGDSR